MRSGPLAGHLHACRPAMPLMMLPGRPVSCNGLRARLHSAGEGPDLVLLPSMLVLDRSYQWLIPVLARRFRVHVIQLPGSGRASRLRRAWSFQRYGTWLTWFLEELGLDRPVLVGHSNSGAAALIAAAERPDLFSRLVLVDAAGDDLRLLRQELMKVAAYAGEKDTIERDDVLAVVSRTLENNIFGLIDQVGRKNRQQALHLLADMLLMNEPPVRILYMIIQQMRLLADCQKLDRKSVV